MKLKMRICAVLTCMLAYAGAVALDLYNAARYKEVAYLNGGHLYTMVMFGIKVVYVVMLVIWPFIRLKKNIRYSNEI